MVKIGISQYIQQAFNIFYFILLGAVNRWARKYQFILFQEESLWGKFLEMFRDSTEYKWKQNWVTDFARRPNIVVKRLKYGIGWL